MKQHYNTTRSWMEWGTTTYNAQIFLYGHNGKGLIVDVYNYTRDKGNQLIHDPEFNDPLAFPAIMGVLPWPCFALHLFNSVRGQQALAAINAFLRTKGQL